MNLPEGFELVDSVASASPQLPEGFELIQGGSTSLPDSSVFQKTLDFEGGIVNDPDDAGGYTAYGLSSLRFGDKVKDIKTQEQAIPIYAEEWRKGGYDKIKDTHTAQHMFDINWLSGGGQKYIVEKAAKDVGFDTSNLSESINSADKDTLKKFNEKLVDRRKSYLEKVIEKRPVNEKFRDNWFGRAEAWRDYQELPSQNSIPKTIEPQEQIKPIQEKLPEEKSMVELIGDKLRNIAAGAGERAGDVAGAFLGSLAQFGEAGQNILKDVRPDMTGTPYGDIQEKFDIAGEKQIEKLKTKAQQLKDIDFGYKESVNWEDVKSKFSENGAFSGSSYANVLEYAAEQGIKSIPDMAVVVASLPAYIFSRSEEIGQERAKNKGKESGDIGDTLEAAPFAVGSALLERIGAKGILNAGKEAVEEVGEQALKAGIKEVTKRISKEGGKSLAKEASTEAVQEGIIEYVGEKFGTGAKMDIKEAIDRGFAGAVAGGPVGLVGGVASSTTSELTKGKKVETKESGEIQQEARIEEEPAVEAGVVQKEDGKVVEEEQVTEKPKEVSAQKSSMKNPIVDENIVSDTYVDIKNNWKDKNVDISIIERLKSVELSKIVVPRDKRGSGIGTNVMQDIIKVADSQGKTITLTPSSDFGGSIPRLKKFYKSFGFVENKGSNKDYEISASMYRLPQNQTTETAPSIPETKTAQKKDDGKLYSSGADRPMKNYQKTYKSMKEMPTRPVDDKIVIGGKELKLKPEDNPTRREGIRQQIESIIGTRLYQDKVKGKSALGFYDRQNSEVRTRNYNDVEVLAHEMAHYLDFHHSMKNKFKDAYEKNEEVKKEVSDLSYTSDPKLVETEGFAEYVRLWLTQYDNAKKTAPKFTERFEAILSKDNKLNNKMKLLQADMHRWFFQGGLARLEAKTSGNQYTASERRSRFLSRRPAEMLRQQFVDNIHAAKVITSDLKGQLGDATVDSYKELQLLNGFDGIFEQSVEKGAPTFDIQGNIRFKGPSLTDVWGKSVKYGVSRIRAQEKYFVARRAIETTEQNRENLIEKDEIREGLKLGEKYNYFKKAFDDFQEYRKNILEFMVETGYITEKTKNSFIKNNKNYVPFHRVTEGVNEAHNGTGSFQSLKGGTQNIRHVYDNILRQDMTHIKEALKTKALRDLYELGLESEDGAKYFTKISPDTKPVKTALNDMVKKTSKAIEQIGAEFDVDIDIEENIQDYFQNNPDELLFWSFGNKPKTAETRVDSFIASKDIPSKKIKKGDRVWVEIQKDNELLSDMIDSLDGFTLPDGIAGIALKTAIKVKQLQTLSITAMMQFAGPNIIRDQQQAFMLSGGKFVPIIDSVRGLGHYLKSFMVNDGLFDEMKAQGGPGGGRVRTFLEKEFGFADARSYNSKKPFYHPNEIARNLLDIYMNIMDSAEISTRLGYYAKLVKEGVTPREAAFKAREISTDFGKHGSYAPFVLLQKTVPFFGAYVQSVDRDLRALFDRNGKISFGNLLKSTEGKKQYDSLKTRMLAIGALYVSIHATLAMLGSDEDKYKQLTPDQKARFYHFFIGDEHYTLPKGHGFVSLLGSFAQGMTDLYKGEDSDHVYNDIMFAISYHFGMDAVPGVLNPIAEVALNKTFTGGPIVQKGSEGRSLEYQYTDRTPQLYVQIGKKLGVSPDKARHIVRGYIGYIEEIIAENTEELMWDYDSWGERPFKRSYAEMSTKQFKPREVPYRTKYTSGYYELKKEAAIAKANFIFAKGMVYKDKNLIYDVTSAEKDKKLLGLDELFKGMDEVLKNVNESVSAITYNKKLTGKEKENKIENLYKNKNNSLKNLYDKAKRVIDSINKESK